MKFLHLPLPFLLLLAVFGLTQADKDSSGLRQSAVFSSNSNPYQVDQQVLSDQGPSSMRVVHSSAAASAQNSFGDTQGKTFGGFGASGTAEQGSYSGYQAAQKPEGSYGGYGPPASVPSPSYPPAVGGYPASTGGYPASQVSIQQPPKGQYGQPSGESYAYHYTHYPQQSHHHHGEYGAETSGGGSGGHSIFGGDLFSGLGSLGDLGSLSSLGSLGDFGGLGGLGGLGGEEGGIGGLGGGAGGGVAVAAGIKALKAIKGIGVVAKIIKHFLFIKPLILFGLLLLVALPFIILFLPIPVITIGQGPPVNTPRSAGSMLSSYVTDLSAKVLSSEECLERIICKLPEVPEKYRQKAKGVWEEVGTKYVTNTRVTRGLKAYFEESTTGEPSKNKSFKCNQRFKCSNKFFN